QKSSRHRGRAQSRPSAASRKVAGTGVRDAISSKTREWQTALAQASSLLEFLAHRPLPFPPGGSVATFDWRSMGSQELGGEMVDAANSGGQFEELVEELNLSPHTRSAHPPNLPLPHHVHRFITLNGSLRRLELSEPLLVVHPA